MVRRRVLLSIQKSSRKTGVTQVLIFITSFEQEICTLCDCLFFLLRVHMCSSCLAHRIWLDHIRTILFPAFLRPILANQPPTILTIPTTITLLSHQYHHWCPPHPSQIFPTRSMHSRPTRSNVYSCFSRTDLLPVNWCRWWPINSMRGLQCTTRRQRRRIRTSIYSNST